eukprot:c23868_g1_i1 orf=426-1763(-)
MECFVIALGTTVRTVVPTVTEQKWRGLDVKGFDKQNSCASGPARFSPLMLKSSEAATCSSKLKSYFLPSLAIQVSAKQSKCISGLCNQRGLVLVTTSFASVPDQLIKAREDIRELIKMTCCNPILVRLGWHDAGTYDKNIEQWPKRGGANGSLHYNIELKHTANAGLDNALRLLEPIKEKYPNITWADLFQLASATAIEEAGGPKIPMRYGRVDITQPEECPPEGNLPDAGPPSPADHLRQVFYRMGFSDKEIVVLSGAHTLGRSRPERSGWGKPETKYTKSGPGKPGGKSWTVQWLTFDNFYFKDIKQKKDDDLLVLPTDAVLFEDPGFQVHAEKYAEDQDAFFKDYADAHAKLSDLGAKFNPPEGFTIDEPSKQLAPEKFIAAKYSSDETPKKELSESMKEKIRAEYMLVGGSPDQALKSNYFFNIILAIGVLAIVTSWFVKF